MKDLIWIHFMILIIRWVNENKRGGYIDNLFNFDSNFFKISAKESKSMDPQQRHMMELI